MNKDFWKNFDKDKMKWLGTIFAAAVGLMLIVGGSPFDSPAPPRHPVQDISEQRQGSKNTSDNKSQPSTAAEEKYLADKLQRMLEMVEGAGEVHVTVQLESSSRAEYAINTTTDSKTTQEKDQAGGTRVQTEDNDSSQLVLIRDSSGGEIPVLRQELAPKVSGVLVVAEGAGDPVIKAQLFKAVKVALGVEPQKILVLAKGK
ncbi:stage III sporulation protein AG [Desulfohalotomaculum tongense]|uniref:hypothetical protein n=1 Tax=Desulforadius tongensis TaxID=1216062 RepID=UPI00195B84BA|nr:hypothetical protein [Desulforadius tongensis]MBM7855485.1 stage III sporulation protein AG [Desulforadius tongensis]